MDTQKELISRINKLTRAVNKRNKNNLKSLNYTPEEIKRMIAVEDIEYDVEQQRKDSETSFAKGGGTDD